MRRRKLEDDEMLVTHKPREPAEMADPEATEQPPTPEVAANPRALAARLAAAQDEDERKEIIRVIQERLGNREAERIIESVRKAGES